MVTIPERLIPKPKIKIDVEKVTDAMLDNAAINPEDESFVVVVPPEIGSRDPAVDAIWNEIAAALGRAEITFRVASLADARTRRYHPEVPAREA